MLHYTCIILSHYPFMKRCVFVCVHYERALNKMRSHAGSGSSSVEIVALFIEVFKSVFIATCAVEAC